MIFEIGLMDQQRVIFTQQFYPLNNTRNFFVSEERKSLLELITRNALDVFNGRITLISNDQYQVIFANTKQEEIMHPQTNPLFFYLICDHHVDISIERCLITKIAAAFRLAVQKNFNENLATLASTELFHAQIKRILRDEPYLPTDRVKYALFGQKDTTIQLAPPV